MASEIVPNSLPWTLIVENRAKNSHKTLEGSYIRISDAPKWTQLNGENFIWAERKKWIIGSTSEKIFCSIDEVAVNGPDMNTKWKYYSNSANQRYGPRISVKPGK